MKNYLCREMCWHSLSLCFNPLMRFTTMFHGWNLMLRILMFVLSLLSSLAVADHIRYSSNILDRKVFDSWIAYKTSDHGDCRVAQEFLINGTLASFFLLQSYGPSQHNAWLHIYGDYIEANVIKVDGIEQTEYEETENLVVTLYKAQKIEVFWDDEKKLSATLPVDGLKDAMKFCGYDVLYHKLFSNKLHKTH